MTLPPLHVVLIGPPGAGKSTVGHALSESIAVEVVSTGDVLRREIATGSALGAEIARRIDGGDFVTDEMIRHVLVARCAALPPTHGLVLDGYPRNIPQAEALPEILAGLGRRIDAVVLLDLPDAVVIERLSGRRMCITPTETYPVHLNDPASLAQCKADNGTLQIRPDDAPDIVRHRLEVYHRNTAPLIAYYAERGLLRRVPATGDPHTIAAAIRTALGR